MGVKNSPVYRMPSNVPAIIPGDLFPLKRRFVIKLGNPSGETIDKLASGSLWGPRRKFLFPGKMKKEEEFQERINLFMIELFSSDR